MLKPREMSAAEDSGQISHWHEGQNEAVFILAKFISLCQFKWNFQKTICWLQMHCPDVGKKKKKKKKPKRNILFLAACLMTPQILPNKQACLISDGRLGQGLGWTSLKRNLGPYSSNSD